MPIQVPTLDDRKYQALLDEALARIPVHNPEWTNFNQSDPGVTLIEVFAFLTENLLYRANQIPERNRLKFLSLLGIPLQPASAARGMVTFTNERGPLRSITLGGDLEVRAGQVPFRTEQSLDVLPIEARIYFKRKLASPPSALVEYYRQLYASLIDQATPDLTQLQFYETVPFPLPGVDGIDLGSETVVDNSLWIALLVRTGDKPFNATLALAREAIAGKTLSLGIMPWLTEASRRLTPGGENESEAPLALSFEIANRLAADASPKPIEARATVNVLDKPGVVQITLPSAAELTLENQLNPLEAGVGDLPPALEDTNLNERVITWLRVRAPAGTQAKLWWAGINTTSVGQRAHIPNERLPEGNGEPDQVAVLSRAPVLPDSVRVMVTTTDTLTGTGGKSEQWRPIDDLLNAGPEVPAPDPRQPPGVRPFQNSNINVFALDAEAGTLRFGDGAHGKRPPFGAILRAEYDYSLGREGNVGVGAINSAPALPAGVNVTNPAPTWGGADAETAREGEKHIPRYLQHRDRLVNVADFETITLRTPGVDIGRVDVIPAYNPELGLSEPGDAAGAVTIMVIPKNDPKQPTAPMPDRLFLDTICRYLDARRLITTELFLRGPIYKSIWVSVGLKVLPGASVAEVREAVKQALLQFLAPLPADRIAPVTEADALRPLGPYASGPKGWPRRKSVIDRELMAVASRVPGVQLITQVIVAEGNQSPTTEIEMRGLELPRVLGLSVALGDPLDINQLRGSTPPSTTEPPTPPNVVPVPIVAEECS